MATPFERTVINLSALAFMMGASLYPQVQDGTLTSFQVNLAVAQEMAGQQEHTNGNRKLRRGGKDSQYPNTINSRNLAMLHYFMSRRQTSRATSSNGR